MMEREESGKYLVLARVYDTDKPRVAAAWGSRKQATRVLERAFGKADENGVYTDKLGQRFWIEKNSKCMG